MHESSVTIFPSITPAATSTIITGAYPAEHGIAGASWYDTERDEVAYYGDDFWVIMREGFGQFVNDFLLRLNGDRLKSPTMFEMIERAGRKAACLNYLVFRGNVPHRVNMPALMASLPGVSFSETIEGPSLLSLGDFVNPHVHQTGKVDKEGGIIHRFGMDDASTGAMLRDLAGADALPDFTVAYFADNDYVSHKIGPVNALPVVEHVDRMLGEAFEAAGGIERFLADRTVIVTSDHGHCDIRNDPAAVIRLDQLLANFRQAELGRPWRKHDELLICPNMRATQIYVQTPTRERIEQIADATLQNQGVDQVMWRSQLTGGGSGYTVATHRGRLQFSRDASASSAVDRFGGVWSWSGDADALGLRQDGRRIESSDYPNPFERIAGVLDLDKSGDIWVTARPGCEFEVPGGAAHAGGASHGALHRIDSLSPVIVAGAGAPTRLPSHMRSLDIAPLCMEILGIPMRYKVGDPRS